MQDPASDAVRAVCESLPTGWTATGRPDQQLSRRRPNGFRSKSYFTWFTFLLCQLHNWNTERSTRATLFIASCTHGNIPRTPYETVVLCKSPNTSRFFFFCFSVITFFFFFIQLRFINLVPLDALWTYETRCEREFHFCPIIYDFREFFVFCKFCDDVIIIRII
jgi:hypothetical protein